MSKPKILTRLIHVSSDGSTLTFVATPPPTENRCNTEQFTFKYHAPGEDGICLRCGAAAQPLQRGCVAIEENA